MKRSILLLFLPLSLFAANGSEYFSIVPIVGIERVQKLQPTVKMKTRGIFGVRLQSKTPILTFELEGTQAQDTEHDATTSTSYKDVESKIRLGVKGNITTSSIFDWYLRGGAQMRQNEQTKTVNAISTTVTKSSKVQPYAGTGFDIRLLQAFYLSGDVILTYTPTSQPNLNDYEIQPSLGFTMKF